jgi:Predicted transcriptional regulator, consists of a Zn-ribbon and ATP-cone domains
MKCPTCGKSDDAVIDSRESSDNGTNFVRRRRLCSCGARFTTYETHDKPRRFDAVSEKAKITVEMAVKTLQSLIKEM